MTRQFVGNKQNEQYLRDLVAQFGEGKWVTIARALAIHGIKVEKASTIREAWNIMNPFGAIWKLNDEEISNLLTLGMDLEGDMSKVKAAWNKESSQLCEGTVLKYTYWKNLKLAMMQLSIVFCRKKTIYKQYFKKMQYIVLKKFLKIPQMQTDDPFIQRIKQSAIIIKQLIKAFGRHRTQGRAVQYEEYTKIASKRQFELAVEHFKYVDMIKKIADRTYYKDKHIVGLCKFQAPTIAENRQSTLYQLLYVKNNWRDMYDTLIQTKDDLTSDYLVNPIAVKEKNNKIVQKVDQQIQKIETPRIKTQRGRINMPNKKRFYSSYCNSFQKDLINDLDEQHDSAGDADNIKIFESLNNKQQTMDNEINSNVEMKNYIDKYMTQAKEYAYLQFKKIKEQ